jgi:hypothetical protein
MASANTHPNTNTTGYNSNCEPIYDNFEEITFDVTTENSTFINMFLVNHINNLSRRGLIDFHKKFQHFFRNKGAIKLIDEFSGKNTDEEMKTIFIKCINTVGFDNFKKIYVYLKIAQLNSLIGNIEAKLQLKNMKYKNVDQLKENASKMRTHTQTKGLKNNNHEKRTQMNQFAKNTKQFVKEIGAQCVNLETQLQNANKKYKIFYETHSALLSKLEQELKPQELTHKNAKHIIPNMTTNITGQRSIGSYLTLNNMTMNTTTNTTTNTNHKSSSSDTSSPEPVNFTDGEMMGNYQPASDTSSPEPVNFTDEEMMGNHQSASYKPSNNNKITRLGGGRMKMRKSKSKTNKKTNKKTKRVSKSRKVKK